MQRDLAGDDMSREDLIRVVAGVIARQNMHTMLSVNPPIFGGNTLAMAEEVVEALTEAGFLSAARPTVCICKRFSDTGGVLFADLACPIHGVEATRHEEPDWGDDVVV